MQYPREPVIAPSSLSLRRLEDWKLKIKFLWIESERLRDTRERLSEAEHAYEHCD